MPPIQRLSSRNAAWNPRRVICERSRSVRRISFFFGVAAAQSTPETGLAELRAEFRYELALPSSHPSKFSVEGLTDEGCDFCHGDAIFDQPWKTRQFGHLLQNLSSTTVVVSWAAGRYFHNFTACSADSANIG